MIGADTIDITDFIDTTVCNYINTSITEDDILNDEISIQYNFIGLIFRKCILRGKACGDIYMFKSTEYNTVLDINIGVLYSDYNPLSTNGVFVELILSESSKINNIKKKISTIFSGYKCLFYEPNIAFWDSNTNRYQMTLKNKVLSKFACKFVDKELSDENHRETLAFVINEERKKCKITANNIHNILIPGTKILASYLIDIMIKKDVAHIKFIIDAICVDNTDTGAINTINKMNWKKRKSIAEYRSSIIKNLPPIIERSCSTFVLSNKRMFLHIAEFM